MAEPTAEAARTRIGLVSQLFRFVLVGGGCFLIDTGTYTSLLALGWPVWLSKSLSFIVGTTVAYLLNQRFTFRNAGSGSGGGKAAGFAAVYTVTFMVNVGTNSLLVALTPEVIISHQIKMAVCVVIAQGLGALVNFITLKRLVFRD